MKKIALSILLSLVLVTGCTQQVKDAQILASANIASAHVDTVQEKFEPYVVNQLALRDLDVLQNRVRFAVLSGFSKTAIKEMATEGKRIYGLLADEARTRWDTLSDEQKVTLKDLDKELHALMGDVSVYLNSYEQDIDIMDKLTNIVSCAVKVNDLYEVLK